MSSPGRKLARQVQRTTPEAREAAKQAQVEKKETALQQDTGRAKQQTVAAGHKPMTQVRQRRSGNA